MGENATWSLHDGERETVLKERGIDFADLAVFFLDDLTLTRRNERRDYGQARYNMIASVEGVVLTITFTIRDDRYRLISARSANKKERAAYVEAQTTD